MAAMGGRGLRRGGVLAGAAALLAGALAKASEAVARAADGEPWLLGRSNTATGRTELTRSGPGGLDDALRVTNDWGPAITGVTLEVSPEVRATGLVGLAGPNGTGVHGFGGSTGVRGVADSNGTGVHGFGGSTGVIGSAGGPGSFGVRGRGETGVVGAGVAIGVRGDALAGLGVAGGGLRGVLGATPAEPGGAIGAGVVGQAAGVGTGVRGETSNGTGVDGFSVTGTGVAGSGGHMGVHAEHAGGGNAVWLGTPDLAGDFHGGVLVRGDLTVLGDKAAAVPLPDGTLGRLYALEAPEAWFEDFGAGTLAGGAAAVALAPDFAAVVRPEGYLVFLTPKGDCNGLYVRRQDAAGFEVRELRGGTGGVAFDYRVVARRKDRPGPRLGRVAPARRAAPARPELPEVKLPEVKLPEVQPPDLPARPPRPGPPARPAPPGR